MDHPLRRPEEILAYRPLGQILAMNPSDLWTVSPFDTVHFAVQLMTSKNIGFLVVSQNNTIVGVLSERDCVRRMILERKPAETTLVAAVMIRNVVQADIDSNFADCLSLMHTHGVRHLPIVQNGIVIAVISIRDLMREAVAHHARVINELERERLTMFTSMA